MSGALKEILLEADAPDGARVKLGVTAEGRFAIVRRGDVIRCDERSDDSFDRHGEAGRHAEGDDGGQWGPDDRGDSGGKGGGEPIRRCVELFLRITGLIPPSQNS